MNKYETQTLNLKFQSGLEKEALEVYARKLSWYFNTINIAYENLWREKNDKVVTNELCITSF